MPPPLPSLHLRHLLRRSPQIRPLHFTLPHLPKFLISPFSSQTPEDPSSSFPIAQTISNELLKNPNSQNPTSISQNLHLNFSHINPSNSLILDTLNLSPEAGRSVFGFLQWVKLSGSFDFTDETVSYFVDYFGRNKDFKAVYEILDQMKGVVGKECFGKLVDRLVRAGRPTQAVSVFDRVEEDYGIKRDREGLRVVVEKLCENGYANYAEKMVKNLANEFFPDEGICDLLIKGWCVDGKLDEARRLAGEMYRGGFEIGVVAYNAMLDCVCKLCRDKDPFRMDSEAEQVLLEMDKRGVPRDTETFNVLIENLCKIRRTEDAMKLFFRMGEWGCFPDGRTYILLTRSLYQAARVGEGDEMIDRMKSSGFGDQLDKKVYYGFLKILCGIERIDHAMSVFAKMKKDGCKPGIKTYDLLMGKLVAHGRIDRANALFNEALKNGVPVEPKAYKLDPRFTKKPKAVKKEKQRLTLPEKMARKRRRLRQIRLSFVKKPKRMSRRAY